jgi:hypothetical protein
VQYVHTIPRSEKVSSYRNLSSGLKSPPLPPALCWVEPCAVRRTGTGGGITLAVNTGSGGGAV